MATPCQKLSYNREIRLSTVRELIALSNTLVLHPRRAAPELGPVLISLLCLGEIALYSYLCRYSQTYRGLDLIYGVTSYQWAGLNVLLSRHVC